MSLSVEVYNPKDKHFSPCHLFIDPGAEASFCTVELQQRLGLATLLEQDLNIITFGNQVNQETAAIVRLILRNPLITSESKSIVVYAKNSKITSAYRPPPLTTADLAHLHALQWHYAPPTGAIEPDILLGMDLWWSLFEGSVREILPSGLVALNTFLGIIVSGVQQPRRPLPRASPHQLLVNSVGVLEEVEAFEGPSTSETDAWALSNIGISDDIDSKPAAFVDHQLVRDFLASHEVRERGRIYINLPWNEKRHLLPDSFHLAFSRLASNLPRYRMDPKIWDSIQQCIQDMLDRDVLEVVSDPARADGPVVYYIPLHIVFRPSSSTTKVRPTLDASAKYQGEISLNDALHVGPSLLGELVPIILQCRTHQYLISSDIEKAFWAVWLKEEERDATRIVW
ncbi:unnamed protein product, partial [Mesorhabditis spiculigera]